MARSAPAAFALVVSLLVPALAGDLDPQPCPAACACRYDRTLWVTDCSGRGLVEVPEGISPEGYSVDLSDNRLTRLGGFPAGCRLRVLVASGNQIATVEEGDLQGLESLVELDLTNNRLEHIHPAAIKGQAGLLKLKLAGNRLSAPRSAFVASDSLKYLDLSRNALRGADFGAATFANCSSLGTLDLSDNPLEELPSAAFAPLQDLEKLRVERCGLSELKPDIFRPLKQLHNLDVSGNALGPAERWSRAIQAAPQIDTLRMSDCSLEGPLPADAFAPLSAPAADEEASGESLEHLDLSGNPALHDPWAAVAALPDLVDLELARCKLTALPPAGTLANLTDLRVLDLSDNPTLGPELPAASLTPLPELQTLRLARCALRRPPADALTPPKDSEWLAAPLQELSLAGNPLQLQGPLLRAPAQGSLLTLDLSDCALSQLPVDMLRGAANLTKLVLNNNPNMTEVPLSSLRETQSLTTLSMQRAGFMVAPTPASLAPWSRLQQLALQGNPWRCDCALASLSRWAAERQAKNEFVLEESDALQCDNGSSTVSWAAFVATQDSSDAYCPPPAQRLLAGAPAAGDDGVSLMPAAVGAACVAAIAAAAIFAVESSRRRRKRRRSQRAHTFA